MSRKTPGERRSFKERLRQYSMEAKSTSAFESKKANRLVGLAITAGITSAVAPQADAAVVYNNPADTSGISLQIDIDGDGNDELDIKRGDVAGVNLNNRAIRVFGASNVYMLGVYNAYAPSSSFWYGKALNSGAQIGPAQAFATSKNGVLMYDGAGPWGGVTEKYLGVKFEIGANVHYGWVKLSSSAAVGSTLTLHEYAYENTVNTAITAGDVGVVNTDPAISIDDANLGYTENDPAVQIDSAATLTDADGDADWDGGKLEIQITANAEAADRITIPDNQVGNINTSGTNIQNSATLIGTLSASEGTVTGGTKLTVTFNTNATNALVQQVLRAVHYDNTSDNPGTSNRTITLTATDKNSGSASDTRTVAFTAENDAPTDIALDSTSVDENQPSGTLVGNLSATDPDN